jgi:hypothetical protein
MHNSLEARDELMMKLSEKLANNLRGTKTSEKDISDLRDSLPKVVVADWFFELIRTFPLAGSLLVLSAEDDLSGLGADMLWLKTDQLLSEAIEAEPGISVLKLGFLPVGGCAMGSGNPYFLDLRDNSDDPPIVRIVHQYAVTQPYPLEKVEIVRNKLSEFFAKVTVL